MRILPFVAALAVACGGAAGGAGSPGSSATCLPIAPMQLQALEHGSEWEPVATLDAGGSVDQNISQRRAAFRLAGDALVDSHGAQKMTCDAARVLHLAGSPLTLRFDSSDALVGDGKDTTRIFVRDSGEVDVNLGQTTRAMPWRVTGVTPATRRTAELLVLVMIMRGG